MNKQKFTGIILLMALSLLGIIAVQIYWMNKSITIKEEQFDQQVSEALARASYRIERNQNANFMSNMFRGMPQVQMRQFINPQVGNVGNDSVFIEFSQFWQDNEPKVHVINGDKNIKVQKNAKDGLETIKYTFDTVIDDGYGKQHIQTYSQVTQPTQEQVVVMPNEKGSTDELLDKPKESQLNQVMEQMVLEFSIRDIPMEESIKMQPIP
jgi:hypothetical protein